jgi:hypothetical protein
MKSPTAGKVLFHVDGQTQRTDSVGRTDGRTDRPTDGQTDGRTDRQTDMAKLTVTFSNSVNASKNCNSNSIIKFQTSVQYITLALV